MANGIDVGIHLTTWNLVVLAVTWVAVVYLVAFLKELIINIKNQQSQVKETENHQDLDNEVR